MKFLFLCAPPRGIVNARQLFRWWWPWSISHVQQIANDSNFSCLPYWVVVGQVCPDMSMASSSLIETIHFSFLLCFLNLYCVDIEIIGRKQSSLSPPPYDNWNDVMNTQRDLVLQSDSLCFLARRRFASYLIGAVKWGRRFTSRARPLTRVRLFFPPAITTNFELDQIGN